MRSIVRVYSDFDPVNVESPTDISEAFYIGNQMIVRKDETAVTFEQVPYLKENDKVVNIDAEDRSVKVFHFDMFPELMDIDLVDMLKMTVIDLAVAIFERMEAVE